MLKKLYQTLLRHRYKLAVFVILTASSVTCVMLVGARVAYSDSGRYTQMIWNLFLAWIPFVLAYLAYALSWKRPLLYFIIPIFAFLWLIFFPNAPYLITDLENLGDGFGEVPVWYDIMLVIWFSWTGLLLGVVSLYLMQEIVKNVFGKLFGWVFVFTVSVLSSVGVYLGRFLRFNSWDIWQSPVEVLRDSYRLLRAMRPSTIGFIGLFTVFFLFVYLTLYAFGHLLQEDNHD
ncbi:MAG: DUF1361 domain-containing protein [Anaerolineae bacterium]|jgi:uncharacterized membrane protein|nr:DUF1361 domain-containing protein [Anaerolineae bacterium]MBT7189653.1 DUF1361 domain-containing protein [Anaerolineae bacterium]MBT7991819.1 DUF1361 domain-containing protein [Anaerolineae bacterium]